MGSHLIPLLSLLDYLLFPRPYPVDKEVFLLYIVHTLNVRTFENAFTIE